MLANDLQSLGQSRGGRRAREARERARVRETGQARSRAAIGMKTGACGKPPTHRPDAVGGAEFGLAKACMAIVPSVHRIVPSRDVGGGGSAVQRRSALKQIMLDLGGLPVDGLCRLLHTFLFAEQVFNNRLLLFLYERIAEHFEVEQRPVVLGEMLAKQRGFHLSIEVRATFLGNYHRLWNIHRQVRAALQTAGPRPEPYIRVRNGGRNGGNLCI